MALKRQHATIRWPLRPVVMHRVASYLSAERAMRPAFRGGDARREESNPQSPSSDDGFYRLNYDADH
jgi:hypothetical protein